MAYDLLTINLILLAFLLFLSGFFSRSEAAFFSLTPLYLHKMKEEHYPFLTYVRQLLKYPRRLLITILVGNEAVNITISAVAASLFIYFFGIQGQWMTVAIMTPVLVIFGEALPKTFAVTYPMRLSAFLSPLLVFVSLIVRPVVWVLEMVSGFLLHKMGKIPKRKEFFRQGQILFVIEDVDAKSIREIRIIFPAELDKTEERETVC